MAQSSGLHRSRTSTQCGYLTTMFVLLAFTVSCGQSQGLFSSLPFHTASGLASRSQHASKILSLSTSSSAGNVITRESCRHVVGLSPKQRRWCRKNYQLLPAIGDGAKLGLLECQRRFSDRRWNCPISKPAIFSKILGAQSKETAFVHSIQSAGITLAIARACSRGEAAKRCGCSGVSQEDSQAATATGNFTWGSCSDNIQDGARYGREFLNSKEDGRTPPSLMSLHDSEAGRQIVSDNMVLLCKCHGFSGTCTHRTCWYSLPMIHVVGVALLEKYDESIQVRPDTRLKKLVPQDGIAGMPAKDDLVHLRLSPSYCEPDKNKGSLGTSGRVCTASNTGNSTESSCENMCCGRGRNVKRRVATEKCSCRFQWCCTVKCKKCRVAKQTFVCI